MGESQPAISIYLDGETSFQLNRPGFSGAVPNMKIQMLDSKNPVTLVLDGYRAAEKTFSLPIALQSGLLELFDIENDGKVSVLPTDEPAGSLPVEAGARNQWFDLKIDSVDTFWKDLLTPGHKYEIRWSEDGGNSWYYYGEPPESLENVKQLPVRRLPRPIKFTVLDDANAAPQFSISLTPTAKTCYLKGEPRFGFQLKVTSNEEEVITVCFHKTPFKELHGLEEIVNVVDDETDDEVEWPYGIGCFEGTEPFPADDMFEEFEPGVPYERTFFLDPLDKESSNGGELEALDINSSYTVELSKQVTGAFSKWRKGRKAELLAGGEKEKEERWRGGSKQIIFEKPEPFKFETA